METEPQALEPVLEEVPEEPKLEVPEEVVEVKQEVPKRRGRPPGAKNKPKPKVEKAEAAAAEAEVAEVAEVADYEPRQEDVALATRYFARHLGQMSQMSLDAKRARWRELFM